MKINSMIDAVTFVLIVILVFAAFFDESHASGTITLTGYVKNDETSEPITFVNVFLAGTTRGTTTDEHGFYEIKYILPGNYDIIASMMGFEMSRKSIRFTDRDDWKLDFRLKPIVLKAPALEVSAEVPHRWKADLKIFEELFLGKTANAAKCKIVNPEVLTFTHSDREFRASASRPLIIENQGVGMELEYMLDEFVYTNDYKIMYKGISKFKPLESNDARQSEKWEANRRSTFNGSLRHFLSALVKDRLKEEGFLVHHKADLPRKISQRMDFIRGIDVDSLISPAGIPEERLLHFDDLLQVYDSRRNVTSWIQLSYGFVVINVHGVVYDPYAIRTFGYWSTLGIAELLPLDYLP